LFSADDHKAIITHDRLLGKAGIQVYKKDGFKNPLKNFYKKNTDGGNIWPRSIHYYVTRGDFTFWDVA
jgi:hypothetical protein